MSFKLVSFFTFILIKVDFTDRSISHTRVYEWLLGYSPKLTTVQMIS